MSPDIRSIFQDSKGNYWFGTNTNGVYRLASNSLTQFTTKDGLADNQVINIQEDSAGNIWFGSGSFTVSKYDGLKIEVIISRDLPVQSAKLKEALSADDLWFYAGSGAFCKHDQKLRFLPFQSSGNTQNSHSPFNLSSYGVYSILKDSGGNIWFGTQAEGVCKYDGRDFHWFKENGLSGPAVLALFEDNHGNIWFGNNGAGLYCFNGKVVNHLPTEQRLTRIYTIAEDQDGNIWIGTIDSGVWKYDGLTFVHFTAQDGLTSMAVNTVYKDRNGELWFGTDNNGLFKFDGQKFYRFEL
ncbi:MAG: two-component regulator propeller domain-containing protein [Flavobacteriales bacterium]